MQRFDNHVIKNVIRNDSFPLNLWKFDKISLVQSQAFQNPTGITKLKMLSVAWKVIGKKDKEDQFSGV